MNQLRSVARLMVLISVCVVTFITTPALAVDRVSVKSDVDQAWVGEQVPFFVELRGPGTFVGASSFTLPQIPKTIIVAIGNPVVSSENVDGATWYVRRHRFALFSQASGTITVPSFEARFTCREDTTGPESDFVEKVPPISFTIQRPPGSENIGFLVTTENFEVTESWEPEPEDAKVGDVFRRVITQKAQAVSGMALAPPSTTAPPGIKVYVSDPEVNDKAERGEFSGFRQDTLSYILQEAGTFDIPATRYVWWDPEAQKFGSTILPARTFRVSAPPKSAESVQASGGKTARWIWLIAAIVFLAVSVGRRDWITQRVHQVWRWWNPPQLVASRQLEHACRRNDAHAAELAWTQWRNTQSRSIDFPTSLKAAVADLHRHVYGPASSAAWNGTKLQHAFRECCHRSGKAEASQTAALPALNPKPAESQ